MCGCPDQALATGKLLFFCYFESKTPLKFDIVVTKPAKYYKNNTRNKNVIN